MLLSKLLENTIAYTMSGREDQEVFSLVYDSRKVEKGSLFVCLPGANVDGNSFIPDVLQQGATALVVEEGHALPPIPEDVSVITTKHPRRMLAVLSQNWFGNPEREMTLIGITGTKGKTTTTYMVQAVLEASGLPCGLIGTIETIIGQIRIPSVNTTPESYTIAETLRKMLDQGIRCAVMEVSSQALMMDRTFGLPFAIAVFTNLSPDHIGPNEHESFEEYLACKAMIFKQAAFGIANADDPHTAAVTKDATCPLSTFAIENKAADLVATSIEHINEGGYLGVRFSLANENTAPFTLDIPGEFSVCNALAAIAICRHLHIDDAAIRNALATVTVKGRVEPVPVSKRFTLLIDYAHNAMALESLLGTLRDYHPKRLVCVFGCGGNRAKSRRYEMGEVAGRMADLTIITSDNPRHEEPLAIIEDIKQGIEKTSGQYLTIPDRKEAIAHAILHGEEGDLIVLAGKGHEDYQEIKGVKYPMDERVLIAEILEAHEVR